MATKSRQCAVVIVSATACFLFLALIALDWQDLAAHWRFWRIFEAIGPNAQGYPEYRHRQTGIVMVLLPGGTFTMGSHESDPDFADENPEHEVTLSPFMIAKYEVTQAQWTSVMGSIPSVLFKGADLPVTEISWLDCRDFCEKTNFAMPTEAQWEYACRAGTTTRFWSGDSEADLARAGWYDQNCNRLHPVGEKPANAFGLHDMHGSVYEWCEDIYDGEFYAKPAAKDKNPVCTSGSVQRVRRGGSWVDVASICRSASRARMGPRYDDIATGFRPVYYPLP